MINNLHPFCPDPEWLGAIWTLNNDSDKLPDAEILFHHCDNRYITDYEIMMIELLLSLASETRSSSLYSVA